MAKKKNPKKRLPYTSEILNFSEQRGLNMAETMLLVVLRSCMNEKEKKFTCWPGQIKLGKKMRCSRATVQRAIASLASDEKNIISIGKRSVRKGGLENNEYSFLFSTQDIDSDTVKLASQRNYAKPQSEATQSLTKKLCIASERGSRRTINQSNVKKQSSTVKATVDEKPNTSENDTMHEDSNSEDKNMKYGFEHETDFTGEMGIFGWYDWVCQENENLRNQVEHYIRKKGSPAIRNPEAFRTSILKRIRFGTEEGFLYVSPEETQAKIDRNEELRLASIAHNKEQRRLKAIRDKKYGDAEKLYNSLPHEDMEKIGLSMEAFRDDAKRKDYLIGMISEMQKILSRDQAESISE